MDDDGMLTDSIAADIARAVNVDTDAGDLGITATITGNARAEQSAAAAQALAGGYATATYDTNLRYDAGTGGTQGNSIDVDHDDSAALGDEAVVTIDGSVIRVLLNVGTTRAVTVAAAVNSHPIASQLVRATLVGNPDATISAATTANLAGATATNVLQKQAGAGAFTPASGLYEATAAAETAVFTALDGIGNPTVPMAIDVFAPVQVAAGGAHSCARFALGTARRVKCWGANDRGQLGQGNTRSVGAFSDLEVRSLPFISLTDTGGEALDVLEVVAGFEHTCARTRDPSNGDVDLYCWGSNSFGQLGLGLGFSEHQGDDPGEMGTDLAEVSLGGDPLQVVAGKYHTCALRDDFAVRCWGLGTEGQLGDGEGATSVSPVTVDNPPPDEITGIIPSFTRIAAGEHHGCGVLTSGKMACWGRNTDNQVGRQSKATRTQIDPDFPTTQNFSIEWTAALTGEIGNRIVIDYDNTGADPPTFTVTTDGSGDCDSSTQIQITVGMDDTTTSAQVVSALNGVTAGAVAAREWVSAVVLPGQDNIEVENLDCEAGGPSPLTGGSTAHRDDPLSGTNDAVLSPVVTSHSTALHPELTFTAGFDLEGVTNVMAGRDFSCAVFSDVNEGGDSNLACWGNDSSLQRGDDSGVDPQTVAITTFGFLVESVTGTADVAGRISAGSRHACAILDSSASDSRLFCWGSNSADGAVASGQLGQDSPALSLAAPAQTDPIEGITAVATDVAAGSDHTCALFVDGRVYCWGAGADGRLGTGNTTNRGTDTSTMGTLQSALPEGIKL